MYYKLTALYKGVLFLALISTPFVSMSSNPKSFTAAKREARKIFANDRTTLYCGCKYDKYNRVDLKSCGMQNVKGNKRARRVEWEHIVPASNLGQHFKCWREKICTKKNGKKYKGRKCCERVDKRFRRVESDLYNLWPADGLVNAARSNYRYASISSKQNFNGCNFKIQGRMVEPRDEVKGLVARASLYMAERYQIRISPSQRKLFTAWDKQFPPTKREVEWAKKVKNVQGNSNPYIKTNT